MKLGFDIDEVICALCDLANKWLKDNYNIDWTRDDFKSHNLRDNIYVEDPKLNEEITERLIEMINDPEIQMTAKPFPNAAKVMRRFRKEGHSLHFITCRKIGADKYSIKWLRNYNIPFDTVHHLGHDCDKGLIGRSLNLDCYVDDLEEHLESMYRYKKRWRKGLVLWTRPWNEDSIDASKFVRINNWEEFIRHLGIHKR